MIGFNFSERARAISKKLIDWLDATTQYPDLKENLDRTWPNYDDKTKWRRFYQHGLVLMADESGILDADGKATGLKLATKSVCYDKEAQPGDIITSGNGRKYMVQPNGSIRKI